MKHITYPSTDHLRNLITNIIRHYNYDGKDAEGNPIYDPSKPKPVIKFNGTCKQHGTFFGVCFNETDGMWCQSKENIITPLKDNAGSAFFAEGRKEILLSFFDEIYARNNLSKDYTLMICSEFAGSNIQKGVGLSNIEKSMFIFAVKVCKLDDEDFTNYWVDSSYLRSNENRIYNIQDFKTYELEIDFNCPQLVQNQIVEWTLEVEAECPVTKDLLGHREDYTELCKIGEGIVFSAHVVNVSVADVVTIDNVILSNGLQEFFKINFEKGNYCFSIT